MTPVDFPLTDVHLGTRAMTSQDYFQNRGDKNGWPVNWRPDHMRNGEGDVHRSARENRGMGE